MMVLEHMMVYSFGEGLAGRIELGLDGRFSFGRSGLKGRARRTGRPGLGRADRIDCTGLLGHAGRARRIGRPRRKGASDV